MYSWIPKTLRGQEVKNFQGLSSVIPTPLMVTTMATGDYVDVPTPPVVPFFPDQDPQTRNCTTIRDHLSSISIWGLSLNYCQYGVLYLGSYYSTGPYINFPHFGNSNLGKLPYAYVRISPPPIQSWCIPYDTYVYPLWVENSESSVFSGLVL